MIKSVITLLVFSGALLTASVAVAEGPILVVSDRDGAAARVGSPVLVEVDLGTLPEAAAEAEQLQLVEQTADPAQRSPAVPVQFVPDSKGSKKGTLWWLTPPGGDGERRFRLVASQEPVEPVLSVRVDQERKAVEVQEDTQAVLRYNQGTVPPPREIVQRFEPESDPPEHPADEFSGFRYYARGDYIHPVYGPHGEVLTDDYSLNHPHHRGISWAWPIVRWRGEARDLWAVRVLASQPGGVWARPVSLDRVGAGPVLAVIEATNVWKWGDRDPIVRERVAIRVYRQHDRSRFLDVHVRLTALVDDVKIGGRPGATYGGFNLRTFPQFQDREIDMHIEPPQAERRQAWFHLTGVFPNAQDPAGVLLLEHVGNPDYPNYPNPDNVDGVPAEYPPWRSVQPAWPGDREVALKRDEPLSLDHRLWIHPGLSDEATLKRIWASYANPPQVRWEPSPRGGGRSPDADRTCNP